MYANYLEDTGKSGFAVTDKLCSYKVAKGRRGIDHHIWETKTKAPYYSGSNSLGSWSLTFVIVYCHHSLLSTERCYGFDTNYCISCNLTRFFIHHLHSHNTILKWYIDPLTSIPHRSSLLLGDKSVIDNSWWKYQKAIYFSWT